MGTHICSPPFQWKPPRPLVWKCPACHSRYRWSKKRNEWNQVIERPAQVKETS